MDSLARDERAIAQFYPIAWLILFPESTTVLTDIRTTETLFAATWGQHRDLTWADTRIPIMGHTPHNVWEDVTGTYDTQMTERFCYQLIASAAGYQITVLTPLTRDS